MYMMTKGKSNIPLIKLSEGFGVNKVKDSKKEEYVTLVCGTNGEKLKPVKVWNNDSLFNFFNKEKLNAEFISKTELVYVKTTMQDNNVVIELSKYKIPAYAINNKELEHDTIVSMKPEIELLVRFTFDKNLSDDEIAPFTNEYLNGKFTDVILKSIYKYNNRKELVYAKI